MRFSRARLSITRYGGNKEGEGGGGNWDWKSPPGRDGRTPIWKHTWNEENRNKKSGVEDTRAIHNARTSAKMRPTDKFDGKWRNKKERWKSETIRRRDCVYVMRSRATTARSSCPGFFVSRLQNKYRTLLRIDVSSGKNSEIFLKTRWNIWRSICLLELPSLKLKNILFKIYRFYYFAKLILSKMPLNIWFFHFGRILIRWSFFNKFSNVLCEMKRNIYRLYICLMFLKLLKQQEM